MFYPRFPANLGLRFWVGGIGLSHGCLPSIRVSVAVHLERTRVRCDRRHLCMMPGSTSAAVRPLGALAVSFPDRDHLLARVILGEKPGLKHSASAKCREE